MPGIEVTNTVSGADMKRIIERFTRRQIAQRLRATGVASANIANRQASLFLEKREGDRRRNPGDPSLHDNFEATYTDLGEFSAGVMEFSLTNPAPHLFYLEYGTGPHEISPVNAQSLAWPGHVHPKGASVHHPGSTRFVGRTRGAISLAMREKFPGVRPIPV